MGGGAGKCPGEGLLGIGRERQKLAHELWPTECLSGQLSQELPMPAHFEAAAEIVTEEMVGDTLACGPDPRST